MIYNEMIDNIVDILDVIKLRLSYLGLVPMDIIFTAIIGGITVVSYI